MVAAPQAHRVSKHALVGGLLVAAALPARVSQESRPTVASVDSEFGSGLEQLTAHERAIMGVVAQLRASDAAASVAALVRDGGEALERVREALEVLGEFDPQLLVQVALDALACAHVDVPGAAMEPLS
jgi:hypothetical protein